MNDGATKPWPTELRLHKDRRTLTIAFDTGEPFDLSAEYLRVRSPSAEVQGHSPDERKTVAGKQNVAILEVNPIGNYAVRLVFDDMHSTGIYSWDYLHELGRDRDANWQDYLDELAGKGLTRYDLNIAHDHRRADRNAIVEIDHVLVGQPEASGRHRLADGLGLVRAVDPVERRSEIERACAERIVGPARHVARQAGLPPPHLLGRRPVRPFALGGHPRGAGPCHPIAADADAVAQRLAVAEHEIERRSLVLMTIVPGR